MINKIETNTITIRINDKFLAGNKILTVTTLERNYGSLQTKGHVSYDWYNKDTGETGDHGLSVERFEKIITEKIQG